MLQANFDLAGLFTELDWFFQCKNGSVAIGFLRVAVDGPARFLVFVQRIDDRPTRLFKISFGIRNLDVFSVRFDRHPCQNNIAIASRKTLECGIGKNLQLNRADRAFVFDCVGVVAMIGIVGGCQISPIILSFQLDTAAGFDCGGFG